MSPIQFKHRMAAHCESGTVAALLNHAGLPISEAMVFGVSGGIFFGYFRNPFIPFPTIVLRRQPGTIRTCLSKRLGLTFRQARFRRPDEAMAALDSLLDRGIPAAVQVDYFYMDYIPEYTRAHFNAHYVTVVGKNNGRYLISDIYHPQIAELEADTLRRARFAKGKFAPQGMMFYPENVPASLDYRRAVAKGIKQAARYMISIPIPFLGVRGIRYFADKVLTWPKLAVDVERLSHEIMMIHIILEERGTGGGGFRFLYATFLQQAAKILGNADLSELSKDMMENGDRWRDISLFVARIGKNRDLGAERLGQLRGMILDRAAAENQIFKRLLRVVK